MSSLDLFIVNIAFPAIGRSASAMRRSVRCRGCSTATRSCSPRCSCRPAAGPMHSAANGRSCSAWWSSPPRAPAARSHRRSRCSSQHGSCRRPAARCMLPTSLGLMLPEFAPRERPARSACGPRPGRRRRVGPAARRAARPGRLAAGLPRQRAGRGPCADRRPTCASSSGASSRLCVPTCSALPRSRWRSARSCSRSSKRPRGAGHQRRCSHSTTLAVVLLAAIWRRSQHHDARRSIDPAMLRVRSFAGSPRSHRSSSSSGSRRCSSAASCSSRASGTRAS